MPTGNTTTTCAICKSGVLEVNADLGMSGRAQIESAVEGKSVCCSYCENYVCARPCAKDTLCTSCATVLDEAVREGYPTMRWGDEDHGLTAFAKNNATVIVATPQEIEAARQRVTTLPH